MTAGEPDCGAADARTDHGAGDTRTGRRSADARTDHGAGDTRTGRRSADARTDHGAGDTCAGRRSADARTDHGPADGHSRRRPLKERLAAGERLYGALLRLPSETLVEMAGVAGFDYVVIDCEHGPADTALLQHHLTAAAAQGVDVLVRVGTSEPALALRCLDLGAVGIIHPHVDNARDAQRAVASVHYPPLGRRGFATYSRAGRFGTVAAADHVAASRNALTVVMIETERACAATGEIAATPGVDAVLVGPADLAADCGFPGQDVVEALVTKAHRATHEAGRSVMTIVPGAEAARAAEQAGAQLVLYNTAQVLMDTFRSLAAPAEGGRRD